jgi:uncharacterized integral membrane protein
MHLKLITILLLLIVVVVFSVQNAATVAIRFLMWVFTISRALVLFFVFLIGASFGALGYAWYRHGRRTD